MALRGDSTALGKAIRAQHNNVSSTGDIPDQAHHLLMSSIIIDFENEYDHLAHASGYQLNGASNGILLPTHFGHQRKLNRQRHRGYHCVTYVNNVFDVIEPIYDRYDGKDTCKNPTRRNFNNALKGAEDTVRSKIVSRQWWLYDWSEILWKNDYCDEGFTNLKSGRAPVTSRGAGLEWVIRRQGKIKRRYKDKKIRNRTENVSLKEWYTKNNYPPHNDIYK